MMENFGSIPQQIDDATLWRMAMRLDTHVLDLTLYNPLREDSLIYARRALDPAAESPLKALEAVVYDNPVLLSDFARTSCIIECRHMLFLPPGLDNEADDEAEEVRTRLFDAAFPDFDPAEATTFLSPSGISSVAIMAADTLCRIPFLRRSFYNINICHHLSPLCRYFLSQAGRASQPRIHLNLRDNGTMETDIIVTARGRLLAANTFATPTVPDVAYFAMALRSTLNLAPETEMLLSGNAPAREDATQLLRQAGANVMPVIFPSQMYRAGKDAMLAPFDLIILPLCE